MPVTDYPSDDRCRKCGHPFSEHKRHGLGLNVCKHGHVPGIKGCNCRSFLTSGRPS